QEGEFLPVGGRQPSRVNIRFIAATHKRLADEVKAGRFRQDLYFRLNIVNLDIPPLRARRSDIALLANLFLERCTKRMGKEVQGFARETMNLLTRHEWPGNVRELENVVEHAVVLGRRGLVGMDDLPPRYRVGGREDGDRTVVRPLKEAMELPEREYILRALRLSGGNRQRTAELLCVNRTTLFNKMKKYDLFSEDIDE
ncbi:MAG: sigma-54-dependent Fis family transcriptional regulator, partial [Myxococcales bacterium]|nr:sigma-54-dependent Fis family transcriptional regulator [Myxococcales bacterium]